MSPLRVENHIPSVAFRGKFAVFEQNFAPEIFGRKFIVLLLHRSGSGRLYGRLMDIYIILYGR